MTELLDVQKNSRITMDIGCLPVGFEIFFQTIKRGARSECKLRDPCSDGIPWEYGRRRCRCRNFTGFS